MHYSKPLRFFETDFGRFACATIWFCSLTLGIRAAASADDAAAAASFEHLRPSLVLIVSTKDKATSAGTGFCIASDSGHSWILTNNHVATNDNVAVQVEDGGIYSGTVIRRGQTPLDIAVVEISRGALKAVTLSNVVPKPGTPIAVAGFPAVHLHTDYKPSVHLGSVNSIDDGGLYLEHDALTDHGNSGGPLFDQNTAVVYGVNTFFIRSRTDAAINNDFAIAIPAALGLLGNAHVAYQTENQQSVATGSDRQQAGVMQDSENAYRIGYSASPASQAGAQTVKDHLDGYLQQQVRDFASGTVVPVLLDGSGPAAMKRLCTEQHLNAVFLAIYDWSSKFSPGTSHYASHAQMGVIDCYGDIVFKGVGSNDQDLSSKEFTDSYETVAQAAADAALAQIRQEIAADPTIAVNLLRYGLPIGTGQHTTGMVLAPAQNRGAVVMSVASYGAAARAGVQRLDVISSLNGHQLAGLQQDDLNVLIAQIERSGGVYDADVVSADGKSVKVQFKSLDIRDYLNLLNAK